MKSEKIIKEMLEQYKFDYTMTEKYDNNEENKNTQLIRLDAVISILSWVLSE